MTRLRFGVLACSSVARRRVIPAMLAAEHVSLERIGSRSPRRARRFGRMFGCRNVGTYQDVLRDRAVDAVYISTPPVFHEAWIRRALLHGKHVYCEKPAFRSARAAAAAISLSRRRGLRLLEGYMFRYHPQHERARTLVRRGAVGRPRLLQGEYLYPRPRPGNIRLHVRLGGGVFSDAAGYSVAAALDLVPSPPRTVSCAMRVDPATGVDDLVAMTITHAGGQVSQHVAAFGLQYRARLTVTGTGGRLEITRAFAVAPDRSTTLRLESDAGERQLAVPAADQFKRMIEAFAHDVLGRRPRARQDARMLALHRVMDAARRAHRERRAVHVPRRP